MVLSVTNVVEHGFCPKFTYYGEVLGLGQYEQRRGTVMKGRMHHKIAENTNKRFVPTKLEGTKISSQKIYSEKHGFVGIADHVVITDEGLVLVERKYSDPNKIHDTLRIQIGLLSILLEEYFQKPVLYALVIFTKNSKRVQTVIDVDQNLKDYALWMLEDTKKTINDGIIPESTYDGRCPNCCYRKICDVGSLNSMQ